MNEIDKTNLTDQTKFRLNEINKIKNSFNSEIQERKTISKRLSKDIAAFDYIDKILIAVSATSGGVSIISFASAIGTPAVVAGASFTLVFFFDNRNHEKVLQITRNKKKKLKFLCWLKVN